MIVAAAFALALVLTLVLAWLLTPARWWRRPNARALALLVAGTWGLGSVLLALAPQRAAADPPLAAAKPAALPAPPSLLLAAPPSQLPLPADRSTYLVFEDLNLRAAAGIHARRLITVPAGATVTRTGLRDGDWWQVRARVGRREVDGWVSSLWLRRAEEAHGGARH